MLRLFLLSLTASALSAVDTDSISSTIFDGQTSASIKTSNRPFVDDASIFEMNLARSVNNRALQDGSTLGMQACNVWLENLEWANYAWGQDCTCETDLSDVSTVVLSCTADCQFCNADASVCYAANVFTQSFDASSGDIIARTQVVPFNVGRSETFVLTTNFVGDTTCTTTIDGAECASCERQSCEDGRFGTIFDCSNIATVSDTDSTPVGVINTCDTITDQEGVTQFVNEEFMNGCEGDPLVLHTCQRYDNTVLLDSGLSCRCTPFMPTAGAYLADCVMVPVECDDGTSDCGVLSVQVLFDPSVSETDPAAVGFGYNNTAEFSDASITFLVPSDEGSPDCIVAADGVLCNSCTVVPCDGRAQIVVDCVNVFPNIATQGRDQCDVDLYDGTPLEFLSTLGNLTNIELPMDAPAMAPADAPVMAPTVIAGLQSSAGMTMSASASLAVVMSIVLFVTVG